MSWSKWCRGSETLRNVGSRSKRHGRGRFPRGRSWYAAGNFLYDRLVVWVPKKATFCFALQSKTARNSLIVRNQVIAFCLRSWVALATSSRFEGADACKISHARFRTFGWLRRFFRSVMLIDAIFASAVGAIKALFGNFGSLLGLQENSSVIVDVILSSRHSLNTTFS